MEFQTTTELLDALKSRLGVSSDYALAKRMNWSQQRVSSYRRGRSSFDDIAAFHVADVLGIDPAIVIAVCRSSSAKSSEESDTWRGILARLLARQAGGDGGRVGDGCAALGGAPAAPGTGRLCIMSTRARRLVRPRRPSRASVFHHLFGISAA